MTRKEALQKNAQFQSPTLKDWKKSIYALSHPNNIGFSGTINIQKKPKTVLSKLIGTKNTVKNFKDKTLTAISYHGGSIGDKLIQNSPRIMDSILT